eukprot:GHVR01027211.1.p1 GENE.GHVR01027211.1~~GHVR01027211.1.p1  ORF type:complete len:149 (-),score=8.07 GHVR01027211.1:313-759(-)
MFFLIYKYINFLMTSTPSSNASICCFPNISESTTPQRSTGKNIRHEVEKEAWITQLAVYKTKLMKQEKIYREKNAELLARVAELELLCKLKDNEITELGEVNSSVGLQNSNSVLEKKKENLIVSSIGCPDKGILCDCNDNASSVCAEW